MHRITLMDRKIATDQFSHKRHLERKKLSNHLGMPYIKLILIINGNHHRNCTKLLPNCKDKSNPSVIVCLGAQQCSSLWSWSPVWSPWLVFTVYSSHMEVFWPQLQFLLSCCYQRQGARHSQSSVLSIRRTFWTPSIKYPSVS